jgi:hypothetical protein
VSEFCIKTGVNNECFVGVLKLPKKACMVLFTDRVNSCSYDMDVFPSHPDFLMCALSSCLFFHTEWR